VLHIGVPIRKLENSQIGKHSRKIAQKGHYFAIHDAERVKTSLCSTVASKIKWEFFYWMKETNDPGKANSNIKRCLSFCGKGIWTSPSFCESENFVVVYTSGNLHVY
jgi:hypothetical protein